MHVDTFTIGLLGFLENNRFSQKFVNGSQFNNYNRKVKEESFERGFLRGQKDYGLINKYMNALMRLEKYQSIVELFENSLQDCDDFLILNYYVNSLARQGKYLQSFYLFINEIQPSKNDYQTIRKCASDLNESGLWQGLVELHPDRFYFRLQYAYQL